MQLSQLFPHVQELNRCLWQLLSLSAEVRSPFWGGELEWEGRQELPCGRMEGPTNCTNKIK